MNLLEQSGCFKASDPRRRAKNAERGRYGKGKGLRGPEAREQRRRQLSRVVNVPNVTRRQYNQITAYVAVVRRKAGL